MNRQLRREQEKKDKKQEKEKQLRRAPKKLMSSPKTTAKTSNSKSTSGSRRLPSNRMTGILAIVTTLMIMMQAVFPAKTTSRADLFIFSFSYVLLGYFLTLWMQRQGTKQPIVIAAISSALLGLATEGAKFLQGTALSQSALSLLLGLIGAAIGIALAVVVYRNIDQQQSA